MFRVTCTPPGADEILPERPETAIEDGYGSAVPLEGIEIAAVLLKTDGRHPGGGVGVGVLTGVGAGVGVGVGVTTGPPQFDVLIFSDQPPAKEPTSPEASSTT